MIKKSVAVALSGGVDSAVSAYLLKNNGYNIIGVTLMLFDDFNIDSAKEVADILKIEHVVVDLKDSFRRNVINNFIDEYLKGRTPNPCVQCNKKIKFGDLFNIIKDLGTDYLALGHFAKNTFSTKDKKYHLYKGEYSRKDQSYFLYNLTQKHLKSILLPLGSFSSKDKVREIAKDIMPEISKKKDSNNICFIPDGNYTRYIRKYANVRNVKGNFIDKKKNYLGKHKGIYNYTIGQRKGLGYEFDKPMYVIKIIPETNEIVLGEDKDTYVKEIMIKDVNYINEKYMRINFMCKIKLCQWGLYLDGEVINKEEQIKIKFKKPERAPASGQSAVFYIEDEVIGGGIIL